MTRFWRSAARFLTIKTLSKAELAQHGEWIVANISTDSFWPITSQKVRWRGVDIWILPTMKGFYPAVAMMVPKGRNRTECEELVMRFLSVLSWVEDRGFMVEGGGLSGGNLPRPMGRDKERGFSVCDEFDLSYFPEVTDEKTMLALALMREGRGLNHVGYAFLSFYRVLEVALPSDNARIKWIAAALAGLTGHGVKEAIDGLRKQGITTTDDWARTCSNRAAARSRMRTKSRSQVDRPGQAARHAPAGLRLSIYGRSRSRRSRRCSASTHLRPTTANISTSSMASSGLAPTTLINQSISKCTVRRYI